MEGFWYYKLVAFLSVIVTSLGDRRCPFFLSSVSTGDYEQSRGWRGGYKLLSPVSFSIGGTQGPITAIPFPCIQF